MTGSGANAAAIVPTPSQSFSMIERHRIAVAGHLAADRLLQFLRLLVEFEQRARMHADHAIDDELQARKADALVAECRRNRKRGPGLPTFIMILVGIAGSASSSMVFCSNGMAPSYT